MSQKFRKIKFNAWIGEAETMLKDVVVYSNGDIGIEVRSLNKALEPKGYYIDEDEQSILDKDENEIADIRTYEEWAWLDGMPLQYIGMTDIDGVEIFEGDILRFGEYVGYVKYDEHNTAFEVTGKTKEQSALMFKGILQTVKCEVIGNIYQSAELLNDTGEESFAAKKLKDANEFLAKAGVPKFPK